MLFVELLVLSLAVDVAVVCSLCCYCVAVVVACCVTCCCCCCSCSLCASSDSTLLAGGPAYFPLRSRCFALVFSPRGAKHSKTCCCCYCWLFCEEFARISWLALLLLMASRRLASTVL
ncbi:unnamed protein product [Polarella glacialis]|uniref:Secreted protein n=1 Tax=Polarella glacialis TaxID=89957 RepID=A0A813L7X0_POLGL|nr:unnamed protein product [Polarella glacialis]CAE8677594.1 unnamed protein product [Polarella glacialis]CAE8722450.1 unnamed protein product [Polarella glacialis]